MARILWRDAQGHEGAVDLTGAEARIGRAMDCAIRTDDAMVSRHHARIVWNGQGFVIEDLGSANGLFFQENRVAQHLLSHGDAVRCGSLWLRYVDAAVPQGPAPVPIAVPAQPMAAAPSAPQQVFDAPSGPNPLVSGGNSQEADEEIRRLRRRVDQLQAELRIYRGGQAGAEQARKLEDLENDYQALEEERDRFRARVNELEAQFAVEGASVKVQRADQLRGKTTETVAALNDLLSSLRINIMAAEGEFDQFSQSIPRASFELIREALRSSSADTDTARDLLRKLRDGE